MKKRKSLFLLASLSLILLTTRGVDAEIDFSVNEPKYESLCASASGYRDNKATCAAFETYLNNKITQADAASKDLANRITENKNNIDKLFKLVEENEKLIAAKQVEVDNLKTAITLKQDEIITIENDLVDRIGLMQEISIETVVYDFMMSSISLEQLLGQIDGINAVNTSNKDLMDDLDAIKTSLVSDQNNLIAQQDALLVSKKEQETLIVDLKTKEAEMYQQLSSAENMKSAYNEKVNNINVGSIPSSPGFIRPTSSAVVTATAWYYPASFGGGWHPGIDLANPSNPAIVMPASGVVLVSASTSSGYGNYAVTAHEVNGVVYTFIYGHMLYPPVAAGTILKQGEQIGIMGSTGFSTGTHLHFEVFKHAGKTMQQVIDQYNSTYDYNFGLGYNSIGNCGSVCRVAPQDFLGLSYGQSY